LGIKKFDATAGQRIFDCAQRRFGRDKRPIAFFKSANCGARSACGLRQLLRRPLQQTACRPDLRTGQPASARSERQLGALNI
jgi:hypothetical protein